MVKTLLEAGFAGKIFPVNPSYQEVLGKQVYPSVTVIPEKMDLALVIIGYRSVPGVLRECAQKGIQAVVVIADGFAERNKAGAKLQEEIVTLAGQAGMRLIGPNTAGIANPAIVKGFNNRLQTIEDMDTLKILFRLAVKVKSLEGFTAALNRERGQVN